MAAGTGLFLHILDGLRGVTSREGSWGAFGGDGHGGVFSAEFEVVLELSLEEIP